MLKIKLKRLGCSKNPVYKIILAKDLSKRNAKSILNFGYYDVKKKHLCLNKELIYTYITKGAYPTNTVRHLLYNTFS